MGNLVVLGYELFRFVICLFGNNMGDFVGDIMNSKFGAAISGVRRTTDGIRYGAFQLTTKERENRFKFFEELSTISPHVFIPLTKLSLSLVKGLRFEGDKRTLVRNFERWAERVNFVDKVQNLSRLFVRNGTYVARLIAKRNNPDKFDFYPLMMQYVTIVDDSIKNPGESPGVVMQPPIIKFYVNETDKKKRQEFKPTEVVYGAFCAWDYVINDILGRPTFGIYGISILEPVADLIRKYLDLVESYIRYIKKYGLGRYYIEYKAIEDLIKEGQLSVAQEAIEELKKEHEQIAENEDIIGVGFDIHELDTKAHIDIVELKESLETDIQVGLLQHPLTMGRAKGTTYAAGYVSEADRMVVLEGLQRVIKDIVNREIIDRRLEVMGREPGSVWVEFEELSKPEVEIRDLLDMWVNGAITREELRLRTGFTPEPVEE